VAAGEESIRFDVFFDYLCPFVYRAAELIDKVRRSGERELDVRWRYFSLTQVNSKDDGWTVWGAPRSERVRGRLAFQAAEAARRQGRFDEMHWRLLRARHRDRLDLDDPDVVESVAREAGLDLDRWRRDVADPSTLDAVAADHSAGVREFGVFGTPTFVFDGGAAAYVRLSPGAVEDGGLEVYDRLIGVAAGEPQILEIKRPLRPA
jgi:predicted DsbA family dithiol-disulfide isomerase